MEQCSAAEIEEKRKKALEKLALKQHNLQNQAQSRKSVTNFKFRSPKHTEKPYQKLPEQQTTNPTNFYGKDKVKKVTCSLISEDRFQTELSEFFTPVIDVFKTIPSRYYDVKSRNWFFHVNEHNLLITKLQFLRPQVIVEKLPKFVVDCITAHKNDYSEIDLNRLDPELGSSLMPFQQEGVRFAIDKNGRCLIADDMGLGKTFQALAIANYYQKDWPLLIATTSSMKTDVCKCVAALTEILVPLHMRSYGKIEEEKCKQISTVWLFINNGQNDLFILSTLGF